MDLTQQQSQRYKCNILLPEVGEEGQKKLLSAKILIVGAGGLGCSVGYYLAAAGIGNIGIIDNDVVEIGNLQRQIAHNTNRIGMLKVKSAKETFETLNPDVKVKDFNERLTKNNIKELIEGYDIVVDCSDNFPTRYLINDACVMLKKPLVSGAVLRFEGHVTTILPYEGHCYRCIFEEMPQPGIIPSSQEAGVLGGIPGVIGSLQAIEVCKLLLGKGDILKNTLIIYNGLKTAFRRVAISKNNDCAVCGENSSITDLIDYA